MEENQVTQSAAIRLPALLPLFLMVVGITMLVISFVRLAWERPTTTIDNEPSHGEVKAATEQSSRPMINQHEYEEYINYRESGGTYQKLRPDVEQAFAKLRKNLVHFKLSSIDIDEEITNIVGPLGVTEIWKDVAYDNYPAPAMALNRGLVVVDDYGYILDVRWHAYPGAPFTLNEQWRPDEELAQYDELEIKH